MRGALRTWGPSSRTDDRLTARALRLAIRPGVDLASGVEELVALADGRIWALERALARLHRGITDRYSNVGARAASMVEAALTATRASAAA